MVLVHNYPNQQLRARASSSSWGGSPTSFLTRNTCVLLCLNVELCLSVVLLVCVVLSLDGGCCVIAVGGVLLASCCYGMLFLVCGVGLLLIFVPGGCGSTLLRATLHPSVIGLKCMPVLHLLNNSFKSFLVGC